MSNGEVGTFRLSSTLIYQTIAMLAVIGGGVSEVVRLTDRITSLEQTVRDITDKANRVPTVETRLATLEADALHRSGPIVDEVHALEVTAARVAEIINVERPRVLESLQKQIDALAAQMSDRIKSDEAIRNDIYQLELRRQGAPQGAH